MFIEDLTNSPVGEIKGRIVVSTAVSARPTRRSIVRGAAWSIPVVAIAATAPAFAASTDATSASASSALKWTGQTDTLKHVSWDLSISTGTRALSSVTVLFTYVPNGGGGSGTFTVLEMWTFAPTLGQQWTVSGIPAGGSNSATATSPAGTFAANTTHSIHTDFGGSDNSTGTLTASIAVTYAGGGTSTLPTLTQKWSQASPGTQEPAPHDSHTNPAP